MYGPSAMRGRTGSSTVVGERADIKDLLVEQRDEADRVGGGAVSAVGMAVNGIRHVGLNTNGSVEKG